MKKQKKHASKRLVRLAVAVLIVAALAVMISLLASPKHGKSAAPKDAPGASAPASESSPDPGVRPSSPENREEAEAAQPSDSSPDVPTSGDPSSAQTDTPAQGELSSPVQSSGNDEGLALDWGLRLLSVSAYSGMYIEDGSDDSVDNIMAIHLRNDGDENIQLAAVTLTSASGSTYSFTLTTLLPGESMIVLEANRAAYDPSFTIAQAGVDNVAVFEQTPSMHEDMLSITATDQSLTVRNISDEEFLGGRVFYKSLYDETFLGGITYMVSIPAIPAGEEMTLYAGHYFENASRLMFVTYG